MTLDPRARPKRNFSDLAELARAPAPSPPLDREEGSGVIDLAALEAADRAAPAPSAPPLEAPAGDRPGDRSGRRPAVAGFALLGAVLIGVIVGSSGLILVRRQAPGSAPAAQPDPAPPAISGTPGPRQEDHPDSPRLPVAAPEESPAVVPSAPPKAVDRAPQADRSVPRDAPVSSARTSPALANPAVRATAEPPPTALAETATPPRSTKSLADRMSEAVQTEAPAPERPSDEGPAPSNPDGVAPVYPSLGAINSALGTALREAEGCVEGDVPISHARVQFSSAGIVQAVTVTGWAAGKPAEGCVKKALMKPRVAPFLQPSYVVPVTIRSN